MSYRLWEALLQDDAERFRQYLANATYTTATVRPSIGTATGSSFKIGSPSSLGTSPSSTPKSRKSSGQAQNNARTNRSGNATLTRSDVNARDSFGRTLLHHAASQQGDSAHDFVRALLEIPFIDLYAQDLESGWTALHRALYFGNVATAQALMQRDYQDATDYTTTAAHAQAGGLVKIKDNEGNSPFEVFQLTIAPRIIQAASQTLDAGDDDDDSRSVDLNDDGDTTRETARMVDKYAVNVFGDEAFAFGSNKNLTLGVGDEDDRHYPERLHLTRPDHLLLRLHQDHVAECAAQRLPEEPDLSPSAESIEDVPTLIANKPIRIQNVVMSKLHTAILTDDPISNLHVCGFGPGGRLGTGDERTSFTYKCIQGGGLARKRVSTIALGLDHSIAICSQGEVFTWGSNRYGQLGYALPEVTAGEVPIQLLPRQLYGYVKKELVIGASASAIHSVIYTASALYTFGKNEGQLGLMDADARSLDVQPTPRRVAPSVLSTPIASVSAIDRATAVLLANHEAIIFTHFGYTRISFRLHEFTNYFGSIGQAHNAEINHITKLTAGANTIAAMSTLGEVFTVDVPKVAETVSANVSTTNPTKARNALPPTSRIWSLRKGHMSATDVAVGQDGSVILCTMSGSVWRKEKRAKIKSVRTKDDPSTKQKDYKFVRVPNITRAIAVRSNAFGAFVAIRKDCDVTKEQITVESPTLWSNLFPLLSFHEYGEVVDDISVPNPPVRFWVPLSKGPDPAHLKAAVINSSDAETEVHRICQRHEPLTESQYDVWITSNATEVRLPVHSFVLKGRSKVMRAALTEFSRTYYYEIPDVLSIEYGQDGHIQILLTGADFLTLANLVLYLYTDEVIDVWHHTSKALQSAARYRSIRVELMKLASALELRQLERAARLMIDPVRCLMVDMEHAVLDSDFFSDADVLVDLADGAGLPAHSVLLTARCPFFEGLFHGRAGGLWMSSRRGQAEQKAEAMRVDLKHIDARVFELVLRHLYADTGTELFDNIITADFDEFAEVLLDVLAAANELMLDRLSEVCQSILGRYITVKNVCHLLNTVSECQVTEFKNAALEYICLNLETMLEQRLLEDLDPDLMVELDEMVQQNQLAYLPFARSNRARDEMLDRYPELVERLEEGKRRRIDSMRLQSRLAEAQVREEAAQKFRVGSVEKYGSSPVVTRRPNTSDGDLTTPEQSPAMAGREGGDDLQFDMDEDAGLGSPSLSVDEPLSTARSLDDRHDHARASNTPTLSRTISRDDDAPKTSFDNSLPASTVPLSRGFAAARAPWQTPSPTTQRTDLRDIMSQASATRVSHLTQSLAKAEHQSTKHQKMSQKERKKQQQQARQPEPEVTALSPATLSKPQSPWQNVRKVSGGVETTKSHRKQSPAPSRPAMTMRQTVAGGTASTSQPSKPVEPAKSPAAAPAKSIPAQPVIQSIRHTPSRASTLSALDARTSMADILTQQYAEKTAVKEAIAKRSLQEIQQEQEFQAWWDSESRRVQEEEAAASALATSSSSHRGKAGRGGRGSRRGSGRGGAIQPSTADDGKGGGQQEAQQHPRSRSHPSQHAHQAAGESGRGGGTGRGRGRGRGRGQ